MIDTLMYWLISGLTFLVFFAVVFGGFFLLSYPLNWLIDRYCPCELCRWWRSRDTK